MSNMNIGAWPMEKEELTDSHVKYREISSNDCNQLFWTKLFLQTSPFDERRYRRIASSACERIVQEEAQMPSSRETPCRSSSIIAVSFSETSTRKTSSNNRSTSKQMTSPISSRAKSSSRRFSCYLKSHNTQHHSKTIQKKLSIILQKNNNNYPHQDRTKYLALKKKPITIKHKECQDKFCEKCLKLIQNNSKSTLSKVFCQSCTPLIQHTTKSILPKKKFALSKNEENELRQIIEIVIEEFQDHFGQALNLSIKQMTQHLLSNINLFYHHYQQEFEQLTKKYRFEFLERFIKLMNKYEDSPIKTNHYIQQEKLSKTDRNSITRPPDILSMSSLSGSLVTIKDQSEFIENLMSPSNSISLSTTSRRSIITDSKDKDRTNLSTQNSSSKRTFTVNRTRERQSLSKSSKQTSLSSRQLIDAYRFRDTLRMKNSHFSSPRSKIQ